jgi:hypothetical protein
MDVGVQGEAMELMMTNMVTYGIQGALVAKNDELNIYQYVVVL